MNQTILAYLKIAAAMSIVGSSVVIGKLITSSFPVFLASELRFLIASIILIPLFLRQNKRLPAIKGKEWVTLFLQALTGVFLFNIFMLYGLRKTSAIDAGVITSTLPAVVGMISFLFLKEKISVKKGFGILFAILGVGFINVMGAESSAEHSLTGNLFIFGAVIGEALFITLGKSVSQKISPLTISTTMSLFGLLLFLPFSIYEAKKFHFSSLNILDWLNILYFGVVVTVLAFLLMYQGLQKVPASSAGVMTSILPLSSILLSFIILKEEIFLSHTIGLILIMLAIFIISKDSTPTKSKYQSFTIRRN
ncbi:DMT family transporter [Bacillus sp. 03113]|uniref:DMT family transporter n=1 Tax=Bacillus sp. 03113 TaxID=2578211 RepID=UPI0015E88A72|nr:DMT family transporter [Bacillus sp. 03113]